MSIFSEHGSLRITSGAIHATVPANDIFVLTSFQLRHVPKSEILIVLFAEIKMLTTNAHQTAVVSKLSSAT